ncbi:MAG: penicillin-binding protein 1A [Rhodospirillaceae bacterium]
MRSLSKFIGWSLLTGGVFLTIILVGGLVIFWHYGRFLPDYQKLLGYEPPTVTRIHAGDGRLLREFASENRVFVPFRSIPKRLTNAFIAAEDKNFYSHTGLDVSGILRAFWVNVKNLGSNKRPVGASTITQQVAKNFLLTNEISLERKIKEAILAFRIEHALSKPRILELYLNEIYLGQGSYGVAAAALNYFDKSLNDLTIGEIAFIAGLPKAPNNYHPNRNRKAALARRDYVIGRMLADKYINQSEARQAKLAPLVTKNRSETLVARADFFVEEVRRELYERFGESKLYGGGMSVRTSLDPRLQKIADRVLRSGLLVYDKRRGWRGPLGRLRSFENWSQNLSKFPKPGVIEDAAKNWRLAVVLEINDQRALIGFEDGSTAVIPRGEMNWTRKQPSYASRRSKLRGSTTFVRVMDIVFVESYTGIDKSKGEVWRLQQIPEVDGGLVVLDPHTGRILALAGGFSFARSEFNRVTQAKRQPGSAFKPFVYLAAMDHGYSPASIVLDAPFVAEQGPGLRLWKPGNYTKKFYGPSTLRLGIERSRNLMTVRLAQQMGIEIVAEYAERLGVVKTFPRVLSAALGAAETTLLEMTSAYSVLVNGGKKISPSFIDRVQDRRGKTIFQHEDRSCIGCANVTWERGEPPSIKDTRPQLVDAKSAYQVVSMMEGVVQRGTGVRLRDLGRPLAGKTGTTNDSRDAWFIGFSPDLAVGVFVGFDSPKSLGRGETGSSVAVPIFKNFMKEALKNTQPIPFRIPPGIKLVRINSSTGSRAHSGGTGTILEAFKVDQIPPGEENDEELSVMEQFKESSGGDARSIKGLY